MEGPQVLKGRNSFWTSIENVFLKSWHLKMQINTTDDQSSLSVSISAVSFQDTSKRALQQRQLNTKTIIICVKL